MSGAFPGHPELQAETYGWESKWSWAVFEVAVAGGGSSQECHQEIPHLLHPKFSGARYKK